MQSITARDRDAGVDGLSLTDMAYPHAAENDVVVRVHAAGFTRGELDWAGTWSDRAGRDRTPTVPGHELSGVVAELGFGTTGLTVGQRVFGLADWTRNGSLAEYAAVEARNLAPLPADVDHTLAAALPISGLTPAGPVRPRAPYDGPDRPDPWRGGQCRVNRGATRKRRGRLCDWHRTGCRPGHSTRSRGRCLLGPAGRRAGECRRVDVVFDVIGGPILERSTELVRAGGTLVTIAAPPTVQPDNGRAVFFIV